MGGVSPCHKTQQVCPVVSLAEAVLKRIDPIFDIWNGELLEVEENIQFGSVNWIQLGSNCWIILGNFQKHNLGFKLTIMQSWVGLCIIIIWQVIILLGFKFVLSGFNLQDQEKPMKTDSKKVVHHWGCSTAGSPAASVLEIGVDFDFRLCSRFFVLSFLWHGAWFICQGAGKWNLLLGVCLNLFYKLLSVRYHLLRFVDQDFLQAYRWPAMFKHQVEHVKQIRKGSHIKTWTGTETSLFEHEFGPTFPKRGGPRGPHFPEGSAPFF